ncbi:hypothetical protein [Acetivibrio cellulolyticus]|uniref:hypothetical protein n=1 Tax=Acetivibrio cellulolyticus TaxID=35830 RepID=UPI0001E2E6BD|nr:hypothetical protein [Acetivibrio cellulolyticus]
MNKNINWLEPWDSLCTEPNHFEQELYFEIGERHVLYGKKVTAIGRRYDCDDFLFKVHYSEFNYAVVHLTYSRTKEQDASFPITKLFKDLNDWVNNCMIPDHSEYMLSEEEGN